MVEAAGILLRELAEALARLVLEDFGLALSKALLQALVQTYNTTGRTGGSKPVGVSFFCFTRYW